MPFLKIEYIRFSYIRLLYYMENRNIVQHWNQEYCTSLKKRSFVQHRKQEFCETQKSGILYITDILRSVNGPCVVHGLNVEHAAAGSWASVLYLASAGRWSVADLCYWKGGRLSHILLWCKFQKKQFFYPSFVYCILLPQLYILHILCQTVTLSKFALKGVVVSPHTCCPQPCPQTVVAIGNVS